MMDERYYHSIEFHSERCDLSLNCIRVCPTQAIRVKKNGLEFIEERCIDCGECFKVCPNDAITAKTDDINEFSHFKHLVAIPSPTLYTQFGREVSPYQILTALKHIGFDDVYPLTWTCEAVYTSIKEFVKEHTGDFPLISSSCPVIVRLIQVRYPEMLKQLIPIDVPKEIAAKTMREEKSRSLGIHPEDIGAIYITPCPAKMISIKQPAEKIKSHLDGAISINDIFNKLFAQIVRLKKEEDFKT
ncbi:MAG: 4Fe-4S binding protein, partial [Candidatus Heimdallarchaeota archaeon]|nr:4Fe-4S binding protein [Candidatus Heimdallarchaeota archaeon]